MIRASSAVVYVCLCLLDAAAAVQTYAVFQQTTLARLHRLYLLFKLRTPLVLAGHFRRIFVVSVRAPGLQCEGEREKTA